MPSTPAALLKTLKAFGLSLPGTQPKSPWPGHDDVAVNDKTFAFMTAHATHLALSVKLPASGPDALRRADASPTGYGLGKSGWVSFALHDPARADVEQLKRWMLESYRAQAPKRLVKALEEEQPWIRAGGLPEPRKR